MARIEILKRGNSNQPTSPQPVQPQNAEPAPALARGAYALGTGLEAGGHLFNTLMGLIGEPQTFKSNVEDLREKSGYSQQQVGPQGKLEEILHGGLEKIPATLALGGGIPQIGLGFLGSTAKTGAKEAGIGPVGQAVAEIGSEVLGSGLGRGFKIRPGKLRTELRPQMEKSYNVAHKQVEKLPSQNAGKLTGFIDETLAGLPTSGLDETARNIAKTELVNVGKNIFKDQIKPKNVWDAKRHLNALITAQFKKKEPDTALVNLYKRTVGQLNEILDNTGKQFPKFGKPFNKAEDLYKGLDAPNAIRKVLEHNTELKNVIGKNPAAKVIAVLGSKWALGIPYTATLAAAPFAARYGARAYDLFTKSKTVQTLAQKIGHEIANDNTRSAVNTALRLSREVKKEEKKLDQSKPRSNIQIIKRGKD